MQIGHGDLTRGGAAWQVIESTTPLNPSGWGYKGPIFLPNADHHHQIAYRGSLRQTSVTITRSLGPFSRSAKWYTVDDLFPVFTSDANGRGQELVSTVTWFAT